jgi:3-isopropylmalate/(R)-2-methylmalate dehydratase small subunit
MIPAGGKSAPELATTWVFGDHVNTDILHPPQYYSLDEHRVRRGLFQGLDPDLQARVSPGDVVVAGRNFGCGSSRETCIRSFKLNGIAAVIAIDFARIFFRNATNAGLPCLTLARDIDLAHFQHGQRARLELEGPFLENHRGERVALTSPGAFVQRIWRAGGLLELLP